MKRKLDSLEDINTGMKTNDPEGKRRTKTGYENKEMKKYNMKRKGDGMEETENNKKRRKMECCHRVVDCVKKLKRQVTQCYENQIKKRKRQDTDDQESQAKKRKTEPKKRWGLKCCQRILHRLRKRIKKDGEDVLRLKLKAEKVTKEERSVKRDLAPGLSEQFKTLAAERNSWHGWLVMLQPASFLSLLKRHRVAIRYASTSKLFAYM
ncbi:hypothetical protein E2C01_034418 [Portunus trituberculatus]|uniref:Uncharacterized protein n=1 Tax=Portunus trituberculatus TaxID=210409 RepID=A0A5B7F5H6_PORTR|nr:hypothetical protein [Portunus trituberculatus]